MITDEHMAELRRLIDEYSKRVSRNPEDRLSTIILDATLRDYESKIRINLSNDDTSTTPIDVDY